MTAVAERTAEVPPRNGRGRRPGRPLLGVRLGHAIVWEAAALLLTVGLLTSGPARVPALTAAGLLLLATLPRLQRRWLYDWVLTRMRYAARRRRRAQQQPGQLGTLRALLPELGVHRAGGRSRVRMGIVHDGHAWIALIGVDDDQRTVTDQQPVGALPMHRLGELLQVDDIAFDAVQVLVHSVTPPVGPDAASELCAVSYRELGGEGTPLTRSVWIALRLDEALCPDAVAARGGGEGGIRRALRRGALRAVDLLQEEGLRAHVLDETEASEALAALAGLAETSASEAAGQHTPTGRPAPAAEEWTAWHGHGIPHVSYRVQERKAPNGGHAQASTLIRLQELLTALPARAAVLSLTLAPASGGGTGCTTLVRITGAVPAAANALTGVAAGSGLRLHRMDGEQAAGLLATLPLGRSTGPQLNVAPVGRSLELPLSGEGLILGTALHAGRHVAVRAFRRRPVRIGAFLPRRSAELLVFRMLGAGATVHVRSPQPQSWAALMRAAGVGPTRLVIGLPGGTTPPGGSPLAPVVIVDDVPGGSAEPRADLAAWQTGITLLPKPSEVSGSFGESGAQGLRRFDTVLVPRLAPTAVRQLNSAFALPDNAVRMLAVMPSAATAVILPGGAEAVEMRLTRTESELLNRLGYGDE